MRVEEEDASERRGFWDEVHYLLGAIEQLTKEREREKGQTEKHQTIQYKNIKK